MTETRKKIKSLTAFCYEFPPIGGGAGNALRHLCREWSDQGIEVTVVTSSQFHKDTTETSEGFTVIRLDVGRKEVGRGRIPEMIRYMIRSVSKGIELSRTCPSDLNVAFMSLPSGLAPWVLSKKFNTPYVTELRGGDVPGFDPKHLRIYHFVLKPLIKSIWSRSSCLITNGSGLQSLAVKAFRRSFRIHSISNGVDSDFYKPDSAQGIRTSPVTAIAAGRLMDSQKNISGLIEIFEKIPDRNLTIVGDGPDCTLLKMKVQKLKMKNVSFETWKSKSELLKLYQSSDCYISASRYEGMPNTALEAMAVGLPLFVSDIGGHQELTDESNGMLFEDCSADTAELFHQFTQNREFLKKMGESSRQKAVKNFGWSESARKRIELYTESISRV